MPAPDTVTDAIELLRTQGYDADFELVDGQLCIAGRGALCSASTAEVSDSTGSRVRATRAT